MVGFIGFGKTTIAKHLVHELPAVRLSNDEMMIKLYGRNPPAELFRDYYNRIDDLIWDLAVQIVNAGTSVILDYGFWSRESRAAAYARAKKITDDVVFHNVICDMETARECVLERTKNSHNELTIDEHTFGLFRPQFQPMGPDEGYSVINHDNNIKEWNYAAYVLPVREINGKKQVALAVYKSGWHGMIGGRLDGNETPREALCREVCEELGESARFIADNAVEIPEKFRTPMRDVLFRRAKNEEHTYFIVKIPADIELVFCEKDNPGFDIKWLDIDALADEKIILFENAREYSARVVIPAINNL